MTSVQQNEVIIAPFALCRMALRALSAIQGAQTAAATEIAQLNGELFADFVESMHSISRFSGEFWHSRTVSGATEAFNDFVARQEQIARRESHRWTEHLHHVAAGARHPKNRTIESAT